MDKPVTYKPICLDLFCGAGGASVGYANAGFHMIGVDLNEQKSYPFTFIQDDAVNFTIPDWVDFIHASPPCQRYSCSTKRSTRETYPDLVAPIRTKLINTGKLYAIENVPGSPLNPTFIVEGYMVGLELIKRRRLFETNFNVEFIPKNKTYFGPKITVAGTGTPTGNIKTWGRCITTDEWRSAMNIQWMNRKELSQAIPPDYVKPIGLSAINILNQTT